MKDRTEKLAVCVAAKGKHRIRAKFSLVANSALSAQRTIVEEASIRLLLLEETALSGLVDLKSTGKLARYHIKTTSHS